MNIFVLDRDPLLAAQYHCDQHVIKMCLETTQLLCTVVHELGCIVDGLYKPTHRNHPCVKWLLKDPVNISWTIALGDYLFTQYNLRYNKVHKSQIVFHLAIYHLFGYLGVTRKDYLIRPDRLMFCNCTPYKDETDVVAAYRRYYYKDKVRFARWNRGLDAPDWFATATNQAASHV